MRPDSTLRRAVRWNADGLVTLGWNETRALLPVLIVGVLAASVAAVTRGDIPGGPSLAAFRGIHELSLVASIAATLALGAQAIGQEYEHRTLGWMLMLPVARPRLFLVKLTVVAAMVLPLTAYVSLMGIFGEVPVLPWLSAGAALCLAPMLTMLCRSTLAGAVFSASVPGIVLVLVTMMTTAFDGSAEAEHAAREAWAWLMIPLLACSAVLGWRLFMRLESIEGGGRDIHVTWWIRTPREVGTSRPLWLLVKKELSLQRMTFALTALYIVSTAAATIVHPWLDSDPPAMDVLRVASAVYWLCLPALIGSLAIAEERQLGTLSWQLQLPVPGWLQWVAKVGTVFSLSLLLSIGVPVLLARVLSPIDLPNLKLAGVVTMVTTAASLYTSSVSTASVRAALVSLATIPLGLWLVVTTAIALRRAPVAHAFWNGRESGWLGLVAIVVVLLLGLTYVNHRPEPPAASRIRRQVFSLVALVGIGLLALEAVTF